MKSGSHDAIAPFEWKPSRPSAHVCWKTSTSSPYAAPTESRLSSTALIGITIERNVTSSSRKQSASTNAEHDRRVRLHLLVEVVRAGRLAGDVGDSTPGTAPTVGGIRSSRSVCSARTDAALLPSPCSGSRDDRDRAVAG